MTQFKIVEENRETNMKSQTDIFACWTLAEKFGKNSEWDCSTSTTSNNYHLQREWLKWLEEKALNLIQDSGRNWGDQYEVSNRDIRGLSCRKVWQKFRLKLFNFYHIYQLSFTKWMIEMTRGKGSWPNSRQWKKLGRPIWSLKPRYWVIQLGGYIILQPQAEKRRG